jgi:hypothetical protein
MPPPVIEQLRYARLPADDLVASAAFGRDLLGLELEPVSA